MSTNVPDSDDLDNEADRAASHIRPSWELDDGELDAPPAGVSAEPVGHHADLKPEARIGEGHDRLPGSEAPHDTDVDRVPSTNVTEAAAVDEAGVDEAGIVKAGVAEERSVEAGVETAKRSAEPTPRRGETPVPPARSKTTRMGLGTPLPVVEAPVRAERQAEPDVSSEVLEPPVRASVSRGDDPIELPVRGGNGKILVLGGAALVGVILIVGFTFFGGEKKSGGAADTSSTPAKTAEAKRTEDVPALPPPPPKETSTAASTSTATASSTAVASAAASAAPAASSAPAAPSPPVAVATPEPPHGTPRPANPPASNPPTPPARPTPPPIKGNGSIIRDTPF